MVARELSSLARGKRFPLFNAVNAVIFRRLVLQIASRPREEMFILEEVFVGSCFTILYRLANIVLS